MKPVFPLLVALALAGCANAMPVQPTLVVPVMAAAQMMTVRGAIAMSDSKGFHLMEQIGVGTDEGVGTGDDAPPPPPPPAPTTDLVTPNALANLARIEVWLKRGNEAFVQVGGSLVGEDRSLTLNNLRRDTIYKVTLKGFKDDPNNESTDATLQMSDDEASTVTFNTNGVGGVYDTVKDVTFQLQLSDYTFAGSAGSNINVTAGEFDSTEAPESIEGDG